MFSTRLTLVLRSVSIFNAKLVPNKCGTRCISKQALVKIDPSFTHTVQTNVCSKFANNHYLLRPWFLRYIPKGGYPIQIDYIDTKPDAPSDGSVKTFLLLHNTPGSYYDFFHFIATFGDQCRVIVPNFPNFSHTIKTGCFWHSAEEKSEFIVDFLKKINVNSIDCLVAHSMAAYTASYLWIYANWETYFRLKSICLLSPVGQYKFAISDRVKLSLITNMSRTLSLRKLLPLNYISPNSGKISTKGIQDNMEITIWKLLTKKLSNYENYHLRLQSLAQSKIPTLFMFSSNDRLYTPRVFYDQLYELNVDVSQFDIYEQYENSLIQSSDHRDWIKVVDFRSAGHYMFNTHHQLIHSYIADLLHE